MMKASERYQSWLNDFRLLTIDEATMVNWCLWVVESGSLMAYSVEDPRKYLVYSGHSEAIVNQYQPVHNELVQQRFSQPTTGNCTTMVVLVAGKPQSTMMVTTGVTCTPVMCAFLSLLSSNGMYWPWNNLVSSISKCNGVSSPNQVINLFLELQMPFAPKHAMPGRTDCDVHKHQKLEPKSQVAASIEYQLKWWSLTTNGALPCTINTKHQVAIGAIVLQVWWIRTCSTTNNWCRIDDIFCTSADTSVWISTMQTIT